MIGVVTRDRGGCIRTERAGLVIGADGRGFAGRRAVRRAGADGRPGGIRLLYGYWAGLPSTATSGSTGPGLSAGVIRPTTA